LWARITSSFILILFAPASAGAEDTFPDKDKAVTHRYAYEVYAGGMNAMRAKVRLSQSPERYHIIVNARLKGFIGTLIPWKGRYETRGWRTGKHNYKPHTHTTQTTWRGETETRSYRYARDGTFKDLTIKREGEPRSTKDIDKGLADNAVDILTGTLNVTKAMASRHKCRHTATAFDGKRRFFMHFKHKKSVNLEANRYNNYSGQAARCIIELEPKGGEWHEEPRGWLLVQEQGRKYGQLPTAWMARVSGNTPAMPVRIEVKTYYGSVVAHLVEYKNSTSQAEQTKRD
jgi:hypothetical protein